MPVHLPMMLRSPVHGGSTSTSTGTVNAHCVFPGSDAHTSMNTKQPHYRRSLAPNSEAANDPNVHTFFPHFSPLGADETTTAKPQSSSSPSPPVMFQSPLLNSRAPSKGKAGTKHQQHHQGGGSLAASLSSVHTDTTKEMTTSSSYCGEGGGGGGSVTTHTTIDESDLGMGGADPNNSTAEDLLDILENASIDLNEQIKSPPRLGSLSQNMTEERRKQLLHQSVTSRSQASGTTSSSSHKDRTTVLHFEMDDDDNDNGALKFPGQNCRPPQRNDSFDFSDVGWGGGGGGAGGGGVPRERQVQRNESFDNCSTVSDLPFSMTKIRQQSKSNLNYQGSNHDTTNKPKPTMTLDEALVSSSPPKTPLRRRGHHHHDDDDDNDNDNAALSPLTVSSAIENSCGTAYQRGSVGMITMMPPPAFHEPGQDNAFASPTGKMSSMPATATTSTETPLIPPSSPDEPRDEHNKRRSSSAHRRSFRGGADPNAIANNATGRNRTVPLASPAGRGATAAVAAAAVPASPGGFLLAATRLQRSYGKLPEAAANDADNHPSQQPQEEENEDMRQQHPPQPKSNIRVMAKIPSAGRIAIQGGSAPAAPPSANGKVVRKIKVRAKDLASLVASQPRSAVSGGQSSNVSLSGGSVTASSPATATILNKVDLRKVQDAFRKIRSKTPTPGSRGGASSTTRKVTSGGDEDTPSNSVVPASSRSRSRSRRSPLENSSSSLKMERSSRSRSRAANGSRRSLASSDAEGDQGLTARTESVVAQPPTTPSAFSRTALASRSRSRGRPAEADKPNSCSSPTSSSRSRSRCRPSDPELVHDHHVTSESRDSHKERSRSRHRPSESHKMGTESKLVATKSTESLTGSPPSRRRERCSEVTSPTASSSFRHKALQGVDPASSPTTSRRSRSLAPVKTPKQDPEGSAARDTELYPRDAAGSPRTRSTSLAPRPSRSEALPSAMDSSEHQSTVDRPPQVPISSRIHSPRLVLKAHLTSSHTAMDASDHHSQVDRPISMPLRRASCVVPGALKSPAPAPASTQPSQYSSGQSSIRPASVVSPNAPVEDARRRRSSSRKPPREDEPNEEDRRRRSSSRKHAHRPSTCEEESRRHRSKSRGRTSGTCSALPADPSQGRKDSSALSPSSANHRSIHNMIVEGHSSINSSVAAVANPLEEPQRKGVERTCSAVAREVGITKEQLQMLQSAGFHISSSSAQRRM